MKKDRSDELYAASYVALNLADYLTTKKILKEGGYEYNPIARFLIKKKCFGVFKIISTLMGVTAIYLDEKPKTHSKTLIGIYSFVVANNLNQIMQHKKSLQNKK